MTSKKKETGGKTIFVSREALQSLRTSVSLFCVKGKKEHRNKENALGL